MRKMRTPVGGPARILPSSGRAAVSVLVVTCASGALFTISALANRDSSVPAAEPGLVSLVRDAQKDVDALGAQVASLKSEVDSYAKPDTAARAPERTASPALSGRALRGPGVTITLTDAPTQVIPEGVSVNDLVIHQQDIEDVMNALWASGAEAMSVQGVRVTGRTVIRCIGNVILVDGQSFSPPYRISAIGDPDELRTKVDQDRRIVNYKAYVALYGLGWDMSVEDEILLPEASTNTVNSYAQVVD